MTQHLSETAAEKTVLFKILLTYENTLSTENLEM